MTTLEVRAVLFDLDDTLWPLLPLLYNAEQALFDWLTVNAPNVASCYSIVDMRALRADLVATNSRFTYDLWALRHAMLTHLFLSDSTDPSTNGMEQVTIKADLAMQVFARARNQVDLYNDVIPVLTDLAGSYALGSISNGFADLEEIGLAQYFKVSLAAHQFGCAKPDPRIFQAACEAIGVDPRHTAYVGDDVTIDVEGAQRAGLRSVWMNRAGRSLPHEADFECRDMNTLLTWLRNIRTI